MNPSRGAAAAGGRTSPVASISLLSLEVILSEMCSDGGLLLPGLLGSSSLECGGAGGG